MRSVLLLALCAGAFAATPAKFIQTVPIQFEEVSTPSGGQWSARGLGYAFRFEKTGTAMRLGDRTLRMTFENSNARAPFTGLDHSPYPINSFRGNNYHRIENYAQLRRTGVYPGIDLLYYSRNGELEYDFEVAPGADPSRIALSIEGADATHMNDRGDLIVSLAGKELTVRKPTVYQRGGSGELVSVDASYRVAKDGVVRFELGKYDRTSELVIDPSIVYVAFIGGSGGDVGVRVGHDAKGYIYIGGYTFSLDFPIGSAGFSTGEYGEEDCFIIKINTTATDPSQTILYSTYYGGTSDDFLNGMQVTPAGRVYFTGSTNSTNFPVTTSALSSVLTEGTHAFITVMDTTQTGAYSQIYSSYFGGTTTVAGIVGSADAGEGIFVDASGFVYVTGYTTSVDMPLVGAFDGTLGGSYDAFVTKWDPTQSGSSSLIFSSYLGGAAQDWGNDVAVDNNGLIYVTGFTFSADFPYTSSTAYRNYSGGGDAFISVINPFQGSVTYSTFFGGGDGFDEATRIFLDPTTSTLAIAGYTLSTELPVSQNAYQPVMPALDNVDAFGNQQGSNGFLAVFNMAQATAPGQGLLYSTYFGGFGGEVIYGLRRDSQNYFYISGYTLSENLPVTTDALSTSSAGGGFDGFVTVLNPSASTTAGQLVYSSYLTSTGSQMINDVDVDQSGTVWTTGVATGNIFPPPYQQFPLSPSTGLVQSGKQSSFLWGFTIK